MSDCVLIMLTIELVCLFTLKMFSFLSVTNRAVNIHEVSTCIFVCVLLKLVAQVWSEPQGLPSTVHFRKYSHIKNNPVLKVTTKFSNEIVAAMFLTA